MKYGSTRQYWNDFVFEAYVSHRADAIYLAGLPDVAGSRPHFRSERLGVRPLISFVVPSAPGTYSLVLRSTAARTIRIGRLGQLHLCPGFYLYVGSAFGPGGLRARIRHHLRRATRPHWHVDYLRRYTQPEAVWYCCGVQREHELAAAIGALAGPAIPMPGFGSSDCGCATHLFWFAEPPPMPDMGLLAWD